MTQQPLIDDLWNVMRSLYEARYKCEGPTVTDPKTMMTWHPHFDFDTFNEIAGLQTKLQSLISRLEEREKLNDK